MHAFYVQPCTVDFEVRIEACQCPPHGLKRVGQLVDAAVQSSAALHQSNALSSTKRLNVALLLDATKQNEMLSYIKGYMALLLHSGHSCTLVFGPSSGRAACPTSRDELAQVFLGPRRTLVDVQAELKFDVLIVVNFWQVSMALAQVPIPVLYWELSSGAAFRSLSLQWKPLTQGSPTQEEQLFHMTMHLPVSMACISTAVAQYFQERYSRFATVVLGVDCDLYRPGIVDVERKPSPMGDAESEKTVLLIGDPIIAHNGMGVALAVLAAVHATTPLSVTWIVPRCIARSLLPPASAYPFRINYQIDPDKELMAALIRGHDALLWTRSVDSDAPTVMTVLASGVAVVTTGCFGAGTFIQSGQNALVADGIPGLEQALSLVLNNQSVRNQLTANARRMVESEYTIQRTAVTLERLLYRMVAMTPAFQRGAADTIMEVGMMASIAARKHQGPAPGIMSPGTLDGARVRSTSQVWPPRPRRASYDSNALRSPHSTGAAPTAASEDGQPAATSRVAGSTPPHAGGGSLDDVSAPCSQNPGELPLPCDDWAAAAVAGIGGALAGIDALPPNGSPPQQASPYPHFSCPAQVVGPATSAGSATLSHSGFSSPVKLSTPSGAANMAAAAAAAAAATAFGAPSSFAAESMGHGGNAPIVAEYLAGGGDGAALATAAAAAAAAALTGNTARPPMDWRQRRLSAGPAVRMHAADIAPDRTRRLSAGEAQALWSPTTATSTPSAVLLPMSQHDARSTAMLIPPMNAQCRMSSETFAEPFIAMGGASALHHLGRARSVPAVPGSSAWQVPGQSSVEASNARSISVVFGASGRWENVSQGPQSNSFRPSFGSDPGPSPLVALDHIFSSGEEQQGSMPRVGAILDVGVAKGPSSSSGPRFPLGPSLRSAGLGKAAGADNARPGTAVGTRTASASRKVETLLTKQPAVRWSFPGLSSPPTSQEKEAIAFNLPGRYDWPTVGTGAGTGSAMKALSCGEGRALEAVPVFGNSSAPGLLPTSCGLGLVAGLGPDPVAGPLWPGLQESLPSDWQLRSKIRDGGPTGSSWDCSAAAAAAFGPLVERSSCTQPGPCSLEHPLPGGIGGPERAAAAPSDSGLPEWMVGSGNVADPMKGRKRPGDVLSPEVGGGKAAAAATWGDGLAVGPLGHGGQTAAPAPAAAKLFQAVPSGRSPGFVVRPAAANSSGAAPRPVRSFRGFFPRKPQATQ